MHAAYDLIKFILGNEEVSHLQQSISFPVLHDTSSVDNDAPVL